MPFLAAHCISSCSLYSIKRHLGRASARRGKSPLDNMGALSALTSGIPGATEGRGIKTKTHLLHVQVNVRGQAERKYHVTTANLCVRCFSSEPEVTE